VPCDCQGSRLRGGGIGPAAVELTGNSGCRHSARRGRPVQIAIASGKGGTGKTASSGRCCKSGVPGHPDAAVDAGACRTTHGRSGHHRSCDPGSASKYASGDGTSATRRYRDTFRGQTGKNTLAAAIGRGAEPTWHTEGDTNPTQRSASNTGRRDGSPAREYGDIREAE
jgi:hypothetical protein